jgi:two-component system CheB/CheR fusion protein
MTRFFDEAPLGLLYVNASGRVLAVNRAQWTMLGLARGDFLGRPISRFHADPRDAAASLSALAKNKKLHNHRASLLHKDGSARPVLIDANGVRLGGRIWHSLWFVRDISERKRLEGSLLEASERESRRIGMNLHDGLGQHLHALFFLATSLERSLRELASPAAAEAGRLSKQFEIALKLTRSLAHGLQPVHPDPHSLCDALRELASRTRDLYHVDCRFHPRSRVLVHSQTTATHLYRIAQEAVNNAVVHAKPRSIRIRLFATPRQLHLAVCDDGPGIRVPAPRARGMGMDIMRYRAELIGGSLLVRRRPGGGTEILCAVKRQAPVPPACPNL